MRTILVVGPEPDAVTALRRSGYRVLTANRAADAFRMLKQFLVSAIVCNLRLTDMTCGEFRRRLLECPEWARIPVIGLTAEAESEEERSWYTHILREPVDSATLLDVISRASPS